jgi:hypothetical protein
MNELAETLLLMRIISELAVLVERAIKSGNDVTNEEIDAAFARTYAADARWAEALRGKASAQPTVASGDSGDEEETDVD